MTLSRPPQYRAFSRAVMDEKSLSPLFPVRGGGGAVVTNDWCITAFVYDGSACHGTGFLPTKNTQPFKNKNIKMNCCSI